MRARPQLPGAQWFFWLRNVPLRVGVITGLYLSCVFIAWLLVANRVHWLEPFANARNLAAGIVMVSLLAFPVLRFRGDPARLFVAGLTAWTLLTITYIAAEMRFTLLESRIGALHMFVLGTISYGLVAVFQWVFLLCAECRHRHVTESRHPEVPADRPPIH